MNTTTKTLWANVNGVWTDLHIRAYYDSIPVFVNGVFDLGYTQNINPFNGYNIASPFEVSGNEIIVPNITSNNYDIGMLFESVDITGYSSLKIKTNITGYESITVNLSGLTGAGYPYVMAFQNYNSKYIRFGVSNTNTNGYASSENVMVDTEIVVSSFATARITEITIE